MVEFLNETFTDTDGTFLPTHDASWEELPWDITGQATTERHAIDTNHVRSSTVQNPGAQVLRWNGDPGADEYDLTATFSFHSTAQASRWHALFVRMTPTVTAHASVDHYRVFAAANLANWQLDKTVGGTETALDTFAASNAATVVAVRVEVRTTGIEVYIDDVLRMSTTDTEITQRGRVGVASRRGSEGGTHWIDDVIGDSVSAGGSQTTADPLAVDISFGTPTVQATYSTTAEPFAVEVDLVTPDAAAAYATAADPLAVDIDYGAPAVSGSSQTTAEPLTVEMAFAAPTATVAYSTTAGPLTVEVAYGPAVVAGAAPIVNLHFIALAPELGHGSALAPEMTDRTALAPELAHAAAGAPETADRSVAPSELGHGAAGTPETGHGQPEVELGHGNPGEPET